MLAALGWRKAMDIPLCQDLQPLLYIDTLNLRFSEMSEYYLPSKQHKLYKQKLPDHDRKPLEQKSSIHHLYHVLSQYGDRAKSP